MRKDEALTLISMNSQGGITDYDRRFRLPELLPLSVLMEQEGLTKWWARRSVPVSQDGVAQMLRDAGYSSTSEYLTANLGLSLNDYYWIKPVDSRLRWKDVSLFSNDFSAGRLVAYENEDTDNSIPHYSPNSSLQGDVEKTWTIRDGERVLVKGNSGMLSTQSLNEVFASMIYQKQGYDNYTDYQLIHINGKPYDFGCCSRDFSSEQLEFVSAYDVVCSEKKRGDTSTYEHFINVCAEHGIDKDTLRHDLEMQILTDYVMSGQDRHLNNIGVLRDAETLKFLRLAPIFDSGGSFFCGSQFPKDKKEMLYISINSFCSREKDMLAKVRDKGILDIGRLPSTKELRTLYERDTKASGYVTESICNCYEEKINLLSELQHGKNPYKEAY